MSNKRYCKPCFNLDQFLSEMHPIESSMVGYYECAMCGDKGSGVTLQELETEAKAQLKDGVKKLKALKNQ